MRALAATLCLCAAPALAQDTGLACTFSRVCTLQTDCQPHDGLPFELSLVDGALAFQAGGDWVPGRPLGNVTPPALSLIFDAQPDTTVLLSVTSQGEAAMTQHAISGGAQVLSVSFFGRCSPAR